MRQTEGRLWSLAEAFPWQQSTDWGSLSFTLSARTPCEWMLSKRRSTHTASCQVFSLQSDFWWQICSCPGTLSCKLTFATRGWPPNQSPLRPVGTGSIQNADMIFSFGSDGVIISWASLLGIVQSSMLRLKCYYIYDCWWHHVLCALNLCLEIIHFTGL